MARRIREPEERDADRAAANEQWRRRWVERFERFSVINAEAKVVALERQKATWLAVKRQ